MSSIRKIFWVWTAIVVVLAIGGSFWAIQDREYTGTDIKLSAGTRSFMSVDGPSTVTFSGASSRFFVLRQETGETIVATPTTPPLGWYDSTYFIVTAPIANGKWLIEKGSLTVRLTSDANMTVRIVDKDKLSTVVVVCFIAVAVWVLAILIVLILM